MMNTISKTMTAALALGSALMFTGAASAQPANYGYGYGSAPVYRTAYEKAAISRQLVDTTCSGRRGYLLETRLHGEVLRGTINRWAAGRIQAAIDDLQHEERRECRERDFYGVRDVGKDYVRIRAWMDQESREYRGGYGGVNGGGYFRR